MSMRFCVLGSGSTGNCTWVEAGGDALLIDAGLAAREIERRLAAAAADPARIRGICISHEHGDHIAGLAGLCRKHGWPVYVNAGTRDALARQKDLAAVSWRIFESGQGFELGGIRVEPFTVPHDAYDPVGFAIEAAGARIAIATDIGIATEVVRRQLRTCDALVLEANHDELLLRNSRRPPALIQRVLGRQGHLSNEGAARLIAETASDRLRAVYLAHLSEECNRPHLAERAVRAALDKAGRTQVAVHLTWPDRISEPWGG
jgi:phosphoribosyl 1,2-cyclic phosphodiesterase